MSEETFDFSQINNKLVYSLSFILILWGLRDFVVSWFPDKFSTNLFGFILSIESMISLMVLILFISIYLYGINYLISNPLNELKKYINFIASTFWFIFFIFPIFIVIILLLKEVFANLGSLATFILLMFGLLSGWMANWSQKQSREMDLLILDKQVEFLKSKLSEKDRTSEFLRYYLILESLVKSALVKRIKIHVDHNKSINLEGATNMLLVDKNIKLHTKEELWGLWGLRNKIVHGEYDVSEKEIQRIKDAIRNLDFDLKESENKDEKN